MNIPGMVVIIWVLMMVLEDWNQMQKHPIVSQMTILTLDPLEYIIADLDGDGTDELIFADRQGSSASDFHIGVLSIDDIPDNGGGLETWTLEYSGVGDANLSGTGNNWDVVVVPILLSEHLLEQEDLLL